MAFLEHRAAGDLNAGWIGSIVTVTSVAGPLTGVLSDFDIVGNDVLMFIGGRRVRGVVSTTVTRGDLDVPGSS